MSLPAWAAADTTGALTWAMTVVPPLVAVVVAVLAVVVAGANVLAGADADRIENAAKNALSGKPFPKTTAFGDGKAAEKIVAALEAA